MYAARKGFHMVTPQPGTKKKKGVVPPLPAAFLPLQAKGRSEAHCTSHELNALNARLKDATSDCMVLTEQACYCFVSGAAFL